LLLRKILNRENGAAFITRSVTFQHLIWRDSSWFVACPSPHYYTPRMGVTRSEFTLAPAYRTCLLVRHSGGPRHLIMAIARCTNGSPQRLLAVCTRLLAAHTGSPHFFFLKTFHESIEQIMWLFSLGVCVYWITLEFLRQSQLDHCSWPFDLCLSLTCKYFIEDFCNYWSVVFCLFVCLFVFNLCCVFIWFWY
jgi:hypothetical protein